MFTVDWFNNPYSDEPSDYKGNIYLNQMRGIYYVNQIIDFFGGIVIPMTKPLPDQILKQFKVDT